MASHFGSQIIISLLLLSSSYCEQPTEPCLDRSDCEYSQTNASFTDFTGVPSNEKYTSINLKDNLIVDIIEHAFQHAGYRESLRSLLLDNNRIVHVGNNAFSDLSSLTDLSLRGNGNMKNIDENAFSSESLESLDLQSCGLNELAPKIFQKLPSIQTINLKSNNLEDIHDELFANLPHLENIYLNENKLKVISDSTFKNSLNLTTIELSGNNIYILGAFAFSSLTKLRYLNLENNKLTNFSKSTFQIFFARDKFSKQLLLSGNPWDCCFVTNFTLGDDLSTRELRLSLNTRCADSICATSATSDSASTTHETTRDSTDKLASIADIQTENDHASKLEETTTYISQDKTATDYENTPVAELSKNCTEDGVRNCTFNTVFVGPNVGDRCTNASADASGCVNRAGMMHLTAMCGYHYYFLGAYCVLVFICSIAVWVIMYRIKKSDLRDEHCHYE